MNRAEKYKQEMLRDELVDQYRILRNMRPGTDDYWDQLRIIEHLEELNRIRDRGFFREHGGDLIRVTGIVGGSLAEELFMSAINEKEIQPGWVRSLKLGASKLIK